MVEKTPVDISRLVIREYREGDEEGINLLHNGQYGRHRGNKEWQWEFREGPCGPSIFVVAEYNAKIVATQALLPIVVSYQNTKMLTAKSAATLIAAEFRGYGVLQILYDRCFELALERGISFIWGFTNAEKPFRKLGFTIPGKVGHGICVMNPAETYNINRDRMFAQVKNRVSKKSLQRFLLKAFAWAGFFWYKMSSAFNKRPASPLAIESLAKADKRLDLFAGKFSQTGKFYSVNRNSDYMDWRIFRNPNIHYEFIVATQNNEIQGYIISGKSERENVGYIVDFCVADHRFNEVAGLLISRGLDYFRSQKVAYIDSWLISQNPDSKKYAACLRKSGFLPVPLGSCMVIKNLSGLESLPVDPGIMKQWFITNIFSEGVE